VLVVKVELHIPRVCGFLCDLEAEADARLGLEVVGAADVVEERLLTFEVAEGGLPAACGKYALVPEEFAHVLFNSNRYTVVGADHRNQVGGNREVVGVGAVGREEVSGRERILEHLVLDTKDALRPSNSKKSAVRRVDVIGLSASFLIWTVKLGCASLIRGPVSIVSAVTILRNHTISNINKTGATICMHAEHGFLL